MPVESGSLSRSSCRRFSYASFFGKIPTPRNGNLFESYHKAGDGVILTFMNIRTVDSTLIHWSRRISMPTARVGLFVVFFWFGALKVLGLSPASPLVHALFDATFLHTVLDISFDAFILGFGLLECLIGILFLIRGAERAVIPVLFLHMITTIMPLFLLSGETWSGFMVPTLEGQYIIKNVLIIAAAIGIAAHLHPMKGKRQ